MGTFKAGPPHTRRLDCGRSPGEQSRVTRTHRPIGQKSEPNHSGVQPGPQSPFAKRPLSGGVVAAPWPTFPPPLASKRTFGPALLPCALGRSGRNEQRAGLRRRPWRPARNPPWSGACRCGHGSLPRQHFPPATIFKRSRSGEPVGDLDGRGRVRRAASAAAHWAIGFLDRQHAVTPAGTNLSPLRKRRRRRLVQQPLVVTARCISRIGGRSLRL